MRTLKAQVQITIDGYVCGLNRLRERMTRKIEYVGNDYLNQHTDKNTTLLPGSKVAGYFIFN